MEACYCPADTKGVLCEKFNDINCNLLEPNKESLRSKCVY